MNHFLLVANIIDEVVVMGRLAIAGVTFADPCCDESLIFICLTLLLSCFT